MDHAGLVAEGGLPLLPTQILVPAPFFLQVAQGADMLVEHRTHTLADEQFRLFTPRAGPLAPLTLCLDQ